MRILGIYINLARDIKKIPMGGPAIAKKLYFSGVFPILVAYSQLFLFSDPVHFCNNCYYQGIEIVIYRQKT